jgi:hypothetical protein
MRLLSLLLLNLLNEKRLIIGYDICASGYYSAMKRIWSLLAHGCEGRVLFKNLVALLWLSLHLILFFNSIAHLNDCGPA